MDKSQMERRTKGRPGGNALGSCMVVRTRVANGSMFSPEPCFALYMRSRAEESHAAYSHTLSPTFRRNGLYLRHSII